MRLGILERRNRRLSQARADALAAQIVRKAGSNGALVLSTPSTRCQPLCIRRGACGTFLPPSLDESEELLDELWRSAALPENVWTQDWEVGDVLIWDNRRVLHKRDAFPDHMRRLMKRCQVLARESQA